MAHTGQIGTGDQVLERGNHDDIQNEDYDVKNNDNDNENGSRNVGAVEDHDCL